MRTIPQPYPRFLLSQGLALRITGVNNKTARSSTAMAETGLTSTPFEEAAND